MKLYCMGFSEKCLGFDCAYSKDYGFFLSPSKELKGIEDKNNYDFVKEGGVIWCDTNPLAKAILVSDLKYEMKKQLRKGKRQKNQLKDRETKNGRKKNS